MYKRQAAYYVSGAVITHVFFAAASLYTAALELEPGAADGFRADAMELAVMQEANGGQQWYWEVPGWDNAWWDGALLMAAQGIKGPDIDDNPAFFNQLGVFVDKWVNVQAPIECVPPLLAAHASPAFLRVCLTAR